MSTRVTIELPDEVYESLLRMEQATGRPVETLACEWLVRHAPGPATRLTEAELSEAWQRLRRHAGAADSGDPRSGDNERIDADLAREYAQPDQDAR